MAFDNIEATFELNLVTPGFLYKMWLDSKMKYWSLNPYQHNEIIKPFASFSAD